MDSVRREKAALLTEGWTIESYSRLELYLQQTKQDQHHVGFGAAK